MLKKLQTNSKKVIFELTVVTIGVFIALVINEWFQNYQQKQHAHELLNNFKYELLDNYDDLQKSLQANEKSTKSIT